MNQNRDDYKEGFNPGYNEKGDWIHSYERTNENIK